MDQQKYQQKFFETLNQRGVTPERAAWLICHLNDFLKSGVMSNLPDSRENFNLPDSNDTEAIPTQETLTQKITNLLTNCGFRSNLLGFEYLRYSILYCVDKGTVFTTKELYPQIAKKMHTTPNRVERSIRHSIESAYDRCPSKFIELMGNSIYPDKKPCNSEFIFLVADRIRNNLL